MSTPSISTRLSGKVAIITGASRGIGAAAARLFAAQGAKVILAARSQAEIEKIASEINAAGGQALALPTNVTDPASVEALVQRTLEAFGRLDAAFNNAGDGHYPRPLAEIDVEAFDRAVNVNLRGSFLAMKSEIPAMLKSGGGAIVNMSSTAGLSGVKGMSGYVAGKHGLIGLTRSAALDYAAQGVRVNVLAPGPIATERIAALSDEQRQPILQAVPQRRTGLPEEVAAAAAWLCSDEAAFVTGSVLTIDGGRMAGVA